VNVPLILYVIINHIHGIVADAASVCARAEEMPARIAQPELRLEAEELVAEIPLQELERLALAHGRRELAAHVNMLWHGEQLPNLDVMPCCRLLQGIFRKGFILLLPEHPVAVLGAPFEVVHVDSDLVRC